MNNQLDISKYTDKQLYNILGLISPSDRELEAKIIQLIERYENGPENYHAFFIDMYNHFFEGSDNESDSVVEEGFETKEKTEEVTTTTPASKPENPNISLTKPLEYSKDQLNPLLNQTIKRTISIDSQNRLRNLFPLTTNFTFNLSDPLRDVVSLKLYSIQIPYTWYTVSNSYGGNFIYIKGTSPGINTDSYSFSIKIPSGNYDQGTMISNINASLNSLRKERLDVSFGTTDFFTFNQSTVLTTANINIENRFYESDYRIEFSDPGYVLNQLDRYGNTTVSAKLNAFMGFNDAAYPFDIVYSTRSLPIGDLNNTVSTIIIDNSNNTIRLVQYDNSNNTGYTVDNSLNEIDLVLTNGTYTEYRLFHHINSVIASCPYLDISYSYLEKVNITDISKANAGLAYYALKIRLLTNSSKYFSGGDNMKLAILLPNDTAVWLGSQSILKFTSAINEMSILKAETSSEQNDFYASADQYILLKCIENGYTNDAGNISQYPITVYDTGNLSTFKNDIKISLTTLNAGRLDQFITTVNNAIINANIVTKSLNQNSLGVFNISETKSYIDPTNTFNFQIDMNNRFSNPSYKVQFSGTILQGAFQDLSGNTSLSNDTFTSKLGILDGTNFTVVPSQLFLTIYPDSYFNQYASPWEIYLLSNTDGINTAIAMQTAIVSFTINGQQPLSKSTVSYNRLDKTFTLTIIVENILTQMNYEIYFYDGTESWDQVKIYPNIMYPLLDLPNVPYSNVAGYSVITGYDFNLLYDTSFSIVPIHNAITDANKVTVTLPAGIYTRVALISVLNNALASNPITSKSFFTVSIGEDQKEHIHFHANILKKYTAKDYTLVFYDIVSFVQCYAGASSVRNITADLTLGWILGYRQTEYLLSEYEKYSNGPAVVVSESCLNTFPYKYFYIILDDYNQSHLNDGLVTAAVRETDIAQPSYAQRSMFVCDPDSGEKVFIGNNSKSLTMNQIYAANQIYQNSLTKKSSFFTAPYIKDIFGIIPIKPGPAGSNYVEYGGTLQNQDRIYFGPVNIHRLTVQLLNDRGDVVDLNGADWSFSLICEQLYRSDTAGGKSKK